MLKPLEKGLLENRSSQSQSITPQITYQLPKLKETKKTKYNGWLLNPGSGERVTKDIIRKTGGIWICIGILPSISRDNGIINYMGDYSWAWEIYKVFKATGSWALQLTQMVQ